MNIQRRPQPPKNRWVAVVTDGGDDTFVARAEQLKGATMIAEETCTHKHKSGAAAIPPAMSH